MLYITLQFVTVFCFCFLTLGENALCRTLHVLREHTSPVVLTAPYLHCRCAQPMGGHCFCFYDFVAQAVCSWEYLPRGCNTITGRGGKREEVSCDQPEATRNKDVNASCLEVSREHVA